jgi:hypothetical protein
MATVFSRTPNKVLQRHEMFTGFHFDGDKERTPHHANNE